MAILSSRHLIDQARKLIAPPSAGRPLQVDLRRAISAAYYAVFHEIMAGVADQYVGKKHRGTPHYALAYRSVDHGRLKTVCRNLSQQNLPKDLVVSVPKAGFGKEFLGFAGAVVDLQERRHGADYDPSRFFVTADALAAIKGAEEALRRLERMDPLTRTVFLSFLAFSPRRS